MSQSFSGHRRIWPTYNGQICFALSILILFGYRLVKLSPNMITHWEDLVLDKYRYRTSATTSSNAAHDTFLAPWLTLLLRNGCVQLPGHCRYCTRMLVYMPSSCILPLCYNFCVHLTHMKVPGEKQLLRPLSCKSSSSLSAAHRQGRETDTHTLLVSCPVEHLPTDRRWWSVSGLSPARQPWQTSSCPSRRPYPNATTLHQPTLLLQS